MSDRVRGGPADGPRPSFLKAGHGKPRQPLVANSTVELLVHDEVPGADMYGGIISIPPGVAGPLHWHSVGEFAYVLAGEAVLTDVDGTETTLTTNGSIWQPAGRNGAHAVRNPTNSPFVALFIYPSPGGRQPDFNLLD